MEIDGKEDVEKDSCYISSSDNVNETDIEDAINYFSIKTAKMMIERMLKRRIKTKE